MALTSQTSDQYHRELSRRGVRLTLAIYKRDGVSDQTDLIQGTLDLLIMRTIAREPMHGWAIAQRIQQMSDELLKVQ
jgi:hypothetical protein